MKVNSTLISITSLPEERWKECRDLRLQALQKDPIAFSSSYEEEKDLSEHEWRQRIKNALFAIINDTPVGMVVMIVESLSDNEDIASIYGLYVNSACRGKGIGNQLLTEAMISLKKLETLKKIKLSVNCEQKHAITLYEKLHFQVVGTLKKKILYQGNYYDELMMELLK